MLELVNRGYVYRATPISQEAESLFSSMLWCRPKDV